MTSEPDKSKPKRRWWQYSLRTLLVGLTVFGVWFGWLVHRAHEQRRVVEWVREMGGIVRYDYEGADAGSANVVDAKPSAPNWLLDSLGVDYFHEVSRVDLNSSDLTPLAKLTSLETLFICDRRVRDLAPLANLTSLKRIGFDHTQVSDLTPLATLTNLEVIQLTDTPVSDLTPLATLTNLEVLFLDDTQVRDLTPLTKLPRLKSLSLEGTPVSDLTPLANMTSLQLIYVVDTKVSEPQVKELRRALPKCIIIWWTHSDRSP